MPEQAQHPSPGDLSAFSLGQLPPKEAEVVESHVNECDSCCETLMGIASDDTFVSDLRRANQAAQKTFIEGSQGNSELAMIPTAIANHPRYEVLRMIGRGGMGDVYLARHRMMDRLVALKIINRELVRKQSAIERFHREVKAAARLSHPNIVTAFDAEQADDVHFLVMEYVDGTDLSEVVHEQGSLSVDQACEYARQAALGLQHAHDLGMVHRDIKPHNLMVVGHSSQDETAEPAGIVKILDFGLASLTSAIPDDDQNGDNVASGLTLAGAIMGTPDYIAPEQATNAHQADIRSDIYSLGATLYFLLTGQPPFGIGSVTEKLKSHAEDEIVPVSTIFSEVPVEVDALIAKMMAKDPAERFQTPVAVAEAIERVMLQDENATGRSIIPTRPFPNERKAFKVFTVIASILLVIFAAGIFYVQTNHGVVRVEVSDPSLSVTIEGQKITMQDGDKQITIQPGIETLMIQHGDFKFETDEFQIKRSDKLTFKVELISREIVISLDGEHFGARNLPDQQRPISNASQPMGSDSSNMRLEEILRLEQLNKYVLNVSFSPDGGRLVTACGDREQGVVLWDARNGRKQVTYSGHKSAVHNAQYSPDGTFIVSVGKDSLVRILDPWTLKQRDQFEGHTGYVSALAISSDSRYIATGSDNWNRKDGDAAVRVWDMQTKQQLWSRSLSQENSDKGQVEGISFSPDGTQLVTLRLSGPETDCITIWNAKTGDPIRRYGRGGSSPKCVAWSPDGKLIATGHTAILVDKNKWSDPEHCVIRLYDATTGKVIRTLIGHESAVDTVAFSPDGRLLVSGSGGQYLNDAYYEKNAMDNSVRIWDVTTGRELLRKDFDQAVKSATFSPDGTKLVTSTGAVGDEPHVSLWRLITDNPEELTTNTGLNSKLIVLERKLPAHPQSIRGVGFQGAEQVVTVSRIGEVRISNVLDGGTLEKFQLPFGGVTRISADGNLVAVAETIDGNKSSRIVLWEIEGKIQRWSINFPAEYVGSLQFTSGGRLLVVAHGEPGLAAILDLDNGKMVWQASGGGVHPAAAISPNGDRVFLVKFRGEGVPSTAHVHHFESDDSVDLAMSNDERVEAAEWSHDGQYVIACVQDGTVRVWNAETGAKIRQWQADQNRVSSLTLSPDGETLFVGGTSRISSWKWRSGKQLASVETASLEGLHLAVSPDGRQLITGGGWLWEDGKIRSTHDYAPRIWHLREVKDQ
ncbi:protein kinase [Rubinisphaera sp.]|uniref:protein kinase domain-containing protein n=1 Tax=Rubinisphaera sp. TaxID=2024857 RepID=UPI000C104820|nr:protein kinase [Rubinisphaera sp.]MBV09071.1 hypothetical protein [Rubinisphaera sp.]HCS53081.1 hypothetical protein [Planctomycetaceae bacterium]